MANTKKTSKPATAEKAPVDASAKPVAAKESKKSTKKPAEESAVLYVEANGKQYASAEIIKMCKENFRANNPGKQIRNISVYVNVAESKAYYVVNKKADGLYIEL